MKRGAVRSRREKAERAERESRREESKGNGERCEGRKKRDREMGKQVEGER
jgi:hypothetical protein